MLSSFHSLVLYLRRRSVLHAAFHGSGPCILHLYMHLLPLYSPRISGSCSYNTSTIFQSSLRTSRAMDASSLFSSSQYTLFPSTPNFAPIWLSHGGRLRAHGFYYPAFGGLELLIFDTWKGSESLMGFDSWYGKLRVMVFVGRRVGVQGVGRK